MIFQRYSNQLWSIRFEQVVGPSRRQNQSFAHPCCPQKAALEPSGGARWTRAETPVSSIRPLRDDHNRTFVAHHHLELNRQAAVRHRSGDKGLARRIVGDP